jgi:hypothetical protein
MAVLPESRSDAEPLVGVQGTDKYMRADEIIDCRIDPAVACEADPGNPRR